MSRLERRKDSNDSELSVDVEKAYFSPRGVMLEEENPRANIPVDGTHKMD